MRYQQVTETKYPVLWQTRVRGSEGDYYLQHCKTGEEFVLDELQAQVLCQCDGRQTIKSLATEFAKPDNDLTLEDLVSFLRTLSEADLITVENSRMVFTFPPLQKAPYLQEVHIDATGRCNLYGKCKHCYGRQAFENTLQEEMTITELTAFIKQMEEMNVASCVLSGGEIFMRKDLCSIISHLSQRGIHVKSIFTNGTIWNKKVVDELMACGIVTPFFISLDGHTPAINDYMRGKGNFVKTVNFVKRVQAAGFPAVVNTMVIKQNVSYLMEMCHFMERLGVYRWRLSVPREQGETILNKDEILPDWEDVFVAYEQLLRYALTKDGPMKIQIGSIFKSEVVRDKVYYLFRPESSCCEYKRNAITVKPNGDVTPCTAFDNLVLGNIREQSLSDIWYSDLTQSVKSMPVCVTECRECDFKQYCGGGCRKIAWELHGSVLAKDEPSCPLYEFAARVARPLLDAHGIQAELLKPPSEYNYDPTLIDQVILGRVSRDKKGRF